MVWMYGINFRWTLVFVDRCRLFQLVRQLNIQTYPMNSFTAPKIESVRLAVPRYRSMVKISRTPLSKRSNSRSARTRITMEVSICRRFSAKYRKLLRNIRSARQRFALAWSIKLSEIHRWIGAQMAQLRVAQTAFAFPIQSMTATA